MSSLWLRQANLSDIDRNLWHLAGSLVANAAVAGAVAGRESAEKQSLEILGQT